MNSLTDYIPSVEKDEKYIIVYLLRNTDECNLLHDSDFINNNAKKIFKVVKHLSEKENLKSIDDVLLMQNDVTIDKQYIEEVRRIRNDFSKERLKISIRNLKDYKVKKEVLTNVFSFLQHTTLTDDFDYDKIRSLANDISNNIIKLDPDKSLKTFFELVEDYKKVIEERVQNKSQRTLGFRCLDKLVVRPCDPGEMTAVFGMKGTGKSLFVKAIETSLVKLYGVCVVSINLEMTEKSNMDRFVSVGTNFELSNLLNANFLKNEDNNKSIETFLEGLKGFNNYLYFSEYELSIKQLDSLIYQAKQKFKDFGVLPDDGYMIITIDLTEQMEDLSGKAGTDLKEGINQLLKLCKKHNCHIINVLQSNENLFRGGKRLGTPESCDKFVLQVEDVEGGSTYAARSRVVMAINRPLLLKRRLFPDQQDEWDIEHDIMGVHIIKQNDGKLGKVDFVFDGNSFRLSPYAKDTNRGVS